MIVDCHTHLSGSNDDTYASDHLAAAQTVDFCFVLAGEENDAEDTNKRLSEYVNKHPRKMVGFAFVNPPSGSAYGSAKNKGKQKNLDYITQELGLQGAVLYCSSCGFHPAHSKAMSFYESAEQLGLPVFFHNGPPLKSQAHLGFAQPFLLDEVARAFPSLKIIIGSMGLPFVEQTLAMVAKHENVFADLTLRPDNVWQIYNIVVSAYEDGVMDKLLFGSGFPFSTAGQCIETLLGFNKLLADTNLPNVPRGNIRSVVERDSLEVLGLNRQ